MFCWFLWKVVALHRAPIEKRRKIMRNRTKFPIIPNAKLCCPHLSSFAPHALCSWLNKLREEMGLLGFHSTKPVKGISAAVDALISPRHPMKASAMGIQSAQDV